MTRELPRQVRLDKAADRQADAWLAEYKARNPKRVKAVLAKYVVSTDEQERQKRRDAGLSHWILRSPHGRD